MKKMFKLAAIAVSMALVAGLVACSSGDDDVVDATTPKYLVTAQIDKYVASVKYNQNVSDDEIKSLKTAHEDVMKFIDDGCADCLTVYFDVLKENIMEGWTADDADINLVSIGIAKESLGKIKGYYGTKEVFHEACVYKPAIDTAYDKVYEFSDARKDVDNIGDPLVANENRIVDGKLNERQAASMKAYTDAAAALKAALNEADSKTCKAKIDAADEAIKTFDKLENKNVTKTEIAKVTKAVDEMCKEIKTKVYDKLTTKTESGWKN